MPRNYRELPNEFARERNEYEMEETARAGVYTIRNISEDQLGTYRRRDLITGTQLDAGRKFQKNAKHPKVTSGYTTSIQADSADNAEALADHYLACKSLGPLTSICMEVLVFNRAAGHVHPKGLDLLRFALDHLVELLEHQEIWIWQGKKRATGNPPASPFQNARVTSDIR